MKRFLLLLCALATLTAASAPPAVGPVDGVRDAIAERLALMTDVARFKWNRRLPIADPEREAALLDRATRDAVAHGLPETWARQALAGQIAASRALQTAATESWRRASQPPFAGVADLATVQRPAIDAATSRLIEALAAARCALAASEAAAMLAEPPPDLADADDPATAEAWHIAIDALWPTPREGCQANRLVPASPLD